MTAWGKRAASVVLAFGLGLGLGVVGTGWMIFARGESMGARVIQWGVRLATAGSVPEWEARVAPPQPREEVKALVRKGAR